MLHSRHRAGLLATAGLLAYLLCPPVPSTGVAVSRPAQLPPSAANQGQLPLEPPAGADNGPSAKQKRELLKYRFENMKKDADQLSKLAASLQKEIDKSNQNVLSLDVVRKAGQIEKLAKKIKDSATAGY